MSEVAPQPLLKEFQSEFQLVTPVPAAQHPAAVYLASLSPGSQPTMRHALNEIAAVVTDGECDALTLDWSKLRYQHTAAVHANLSRRFSAATTKKMLCALRRVLKEAARLGLISFEDYARAVDLPRVDTPPQKLRGRALGTSEIAALLDTCQTDKPSAIEIRDAALIALLRGSGLRRNEVVNLQLADFNSSSGKIEVRSGKRKSYRTVYLPTAAVAVVLDWLELRGYSPGALLCPIRRGGKIELRQMTPDAVLKIFRRRAVQADVDEFSPHDLRRTFCSDLLDAGIDIVTVQKLAGHTSPTTTAKYDRRGEEKKRQAVELLTIPLKRRSKQ